MKLKIRCYPLLLMSALLSNIAYSASDIPDCKKLPNYIREFDRSMKVCLKDKENCGIGENKIVTQEFSNNEGKLPKLKKPFSYMEGKYSQPNKHDKNNQFRMVVKVDTENNYSLRYYTTDHYRSFCKLNKKEGE